MTMDSVCQLMQQVTIEPAVLLYHGSCELSSLAARNLLLLKVCSEDAPAPGQSFCQHEALAEKVVTHIQTWRDMITTIGPVIFVMFAGAWSDNRGRRKPLLYFPLFGQILSDLLCILNIFFWNWSPVISALAQVIPTALTGGKPCFLLGEITYMCDVSTKYSRTFRISVIYAMHYISGPFADILFGALFNNFGLNGVYWMSVILNLSSVIFLCVCTSESCKKDKCEKEIERVVDPKQLVQCVKTILKPREGYRRCVILLLVALAPITAAPGDGVSAVAYFFLRYKFNFNAVEFGYYSAFNYCVLSLGILLSTGVFSRFLGISDTIIGVWSQATQLIASVGYFFSQTTWQLLFWTVVDFMHGAGLAVVYSILSKNVATSEVAQVTSVVSVAGAIYPLINLPLFNQLYNYTFKFMAGAVFLLSALYSAVGLVLFLLTHILLKKMGHKEGLIKNPG